MKNHGTTILVKFNLDNSSIIEKIELVIILKRNNSGVGLTIALNPFWGDSLLENEFFKNQNNNEKEKNLNNKIDSNSNNEENVEISTSNKNVIQNSHNNFDQEKSIIAKVTIKCFDNRLKNLQLDGLDNKKKFGKK